LIALGLAYLWQRRRGVGSTVPPADRPSIDERLASAFAQLHSAGPDGVPDVEVRLLGLRDLREIALESPRDAWPIAQALAQYVRRVAPRHAQADTAPAAPRADVQAALTLLARRPGRIGLGEDAPLDLSGTDLRGADLAGANLVAVRFDGADLRGAHLDHTDLAGAGLRGVDLRDARGLTLEQLAAAVTDAATRLPDPLR
ncbi:MAG: pentapeptide repeat-containing protein, partial [Actinobacteria bacterium]|nr:pentapeptide repeat-containing protein [Actinomycetota bacterium]